MEDTPGDAFRRLQKFLEQMIRESMEDEDSDHGPVGFTIIIHGSGPVPGGFPMGRAGPAPESGGALEPHAEVHELEDEVLVLAELPGMSGDQVRLELEEGGIRISASDGAREFRGRADLPPVEPASMTATCRNGVLEVRFRRVHPAGE